MIVFDEFGDGLGIVLRCEGEVCGDDIIAAKEKVATSQNVGRWMFGVLDQSRVTAANYTTTDVHRAAVRDHHLAKLTRPGFLVAVIAASDFQFGVFRMWQLLTDDVPWRTCVFRDCQLAQNWLRDEVKRVFEVDLPEPLLLPAAEGRR